MAAKRRVRLAGQGRLGSVKAAKSLGSSSGGQHPALQILRAEEPITVRFLEEPAEWFGYMEHYDPQKTQFVTCTMGDCCDELQKASQSVLASAYVHDENKVKAIKMKSSLVEILISYYEKYGTMRDRDYELRRSGTGKNDTKYFAVPEDRQKMNLSRFTPIDPEEVLLHGLEDQDDEEDEKPRRSSGRDMDDEYPDDDYDEDEEDEPAPARRRVAKKTPARKVARRK